MDRIVSIIPCSRNMVQPKYLVLKLPMKCQYKSYQDTLLFSTNKLTPKISVIRACQSLSNKKTTDDRSKTWSTWMIES